ncbi:ARM repeat-containing protein [Cubamyces sp. BRFM 1775]|nr:ARM repeat-containing protein [Cubamyces sp. BRFM 1775]
MPRENRKRGKKHKKKTEEVADVSQDPAPYIEEQEAVEAGPSWIVSARDSTTVDQNAPFGYVDSEIKAYFRTVDVQIREWQETKPEVAEDADVDPNEDRRLFFVAALNEMSEKEKQLATDPDCSTILERMIHSMDDFARRVFMDRLCGSFEQLSKHRFASHVCQTLLNVAADTVSREARNIFPPTPEGEAEDGELRTLTQLTLDACEELLPSLSSLILDPFASHVIRALLLLLAPDVLGSVDDGASHSSTFALRSKKSAAYKARQGPMKSVFAEADVQQQKAARTAPKEFRKIAKGFVSALREQLGENEVRALAANQVASPVLQMLLELEASFHMSDTPGSLMDHVLVGLITLLHEDPKATAPESDYLVTLLRDPTASHLLETLVLRSPQRIFDLLWQTYFTGKLARLAVHPVANFVVAKAFERLSSEQFQAAIEEVRSVGGKVVSEYQIILLLCVVFPLGLCNQTDTLLQLVASAFDLNEDEEKRLFVPCVLRLKPLAEYKRAIETSQKAAEEHTGEEPKYKRRKTEDPLEPKTQGAVLLQSVLRLPSPHVEVVTTSLQALEVNELIEMGHHVTSSRVLDAVLDSPTVPHKEKRKLVMTFIGHYPALVDDRIGSRVGERCWAFADPYLREKIARSVAPHEHALAGSAYGKFFARHLSLHVLRRDPEAWKRMQSESKSASTSAPPVAVKPIRPQASEARTINANEPNASAAASDSESSVAEASSAKVKKAQGKQKARSQDEIDALFDATLGKKVKKAELASSAKEQAGIATQSYHTVSERSHEKEKRGKSKKRKEREDGGDAVDRDLRDVLGAIRAAPKEDKGPKKRKRGH